MLKPKSQRSAIRSRLNRGLSGVKLLALFAFLTLTFPQAALACDPNGIGQAAPNTRKAGLNILKNRRAQPIVFRDVSVAEMLAYPNNDDANLEASDAVVLRGQLLDAHHEKVESPNCGAKHDYHVWIAAIDAAHPNGIRLTKAQRAYRKKHSVVVELTPNIQDMHPVWGAKLKRQLAGKNVCITGWLLFDYEHPPQIGKTRATLWEVHPITGIAVLQPDGSCAPWIP